MTARLTETQVDRLVGYFADHYGKINGWRFQCFDEAGGARWDLVAQTDEPLPKPHGRRLGGMRSPGMVEGFSLDIGHAEAEAHTIAWRARELWLDRPVPTHTIRWRPDLTLEHTDGFS